MRHRDGYDDRAAAADNNGLLLALAGAGLYYAARTAVRWSRRFDFRRKTVLITGASRGLGLLLAREFAEEGARLAICARDADDLAVARDELRASGAEVLAVPCDVTDRGQVEDFVRRALNRFGSIDVLVNNAGTIMVGPMEVMTYDDYEEAMAIHFWGPLHTTLAALPHMRARGAGRIVNISSIGGKIPAPHLLPYTASKFALTGFSEGLRVELAKDSILVTTVCPGLMRTGSPRNAFFKGRHREEYAWFSISDALPVTSMSARRAARKIVSACRVGQAEVVLSVQAKLAVKFHAMFPGLSTQMAGIVNRVLPGPGGIGEQRALGKESESSWSPSVLTALSERAARENNEMTETNASAEGGGIAR